MSNKLLIEYAEQIELYRLEVDHNPEDACPELDELRRLYEFQQLLINQWANENRADKE